MKYRRVKMLGFASLTPTYAGFAREAINSLVFAFSLLLFLCVSVSLWLMVLVFFLYQTRIGWGERSEPQHFRLLLLGFAALIPTQDR
jgi:hypothetical protein